MATTDRARKAERRDALAEAVHALRTDVHLLTKQVRHRSILVLASIAAAVALLGGAIGIVVYGSHQADRRQEALLELAFARTCAEVGELQAVLAGLVAEALERDYTDILGPEGEARRRADAERAIARLSEEPCPDLPVG